MTKELQTYIKLNTRKREELEREIAIKKRSLEIVLMKLSNPDFHLAKELGRGAVKVSKALGVEPIKKPKTVLRKKLDEIETIDIPTVEMPLPAVASEEKKEKKSSWINPFN